MIAHYIDKLKNPILEQTRTKMFLTANKRSISEVFCNTTCTIHLMLSPPRRKVQLDSQYWVLLISKIGSWHKESTY